MLAQHLCVGKQSKALHLHAQAAALIPQLFPVGGLFVGGLAVEHIRRVDVALNEGNALFGGRSAQLVVQALAGQGDVPLEAALYPGVVGLAHRTGGQHHVEQLGLFGVAAGSYTEKAKLFDVVLSTGAVSESNYARVQSGFEGDITLPSQSLNDKLRASAAKQGIPLIEGNIHSSDVFYRQPSDEKPTYWEKLRDERGCLCVEMESFALFANAQVLGKHAACLLTISDSFVAPEITTAEQRQTSFTNMMKVALGAEY